MKPGCFSEPPRPSTGKGRRGAASSPAGAVGRVDHDYYQNRPHAGVQLTNAPRMSLSPNAIYRALSECAPGHVRALTRDEWISMQPHKYRRINRYGINLFKLVYDSDSERFHQMRRYQVAEP
jgi:hypothetical protein